MSTREFHKNAYGPWFSPLVENERLPPLGPGTPNTEAKGLLLSLDIEQAFTPKPVADRNMGRACLAALWLYHDFLDESHAISQDIPTTTGSFWHGIMHRREPDSWNSKYWFQKVGQHPVFPALSEFAMDLATQEPALVEANFLRGQERWNPFAFVDLCESARSGNDALESLCRKIQLREWQLLFDYCYIVASR